MVNFKGKMWPWVCVAGLGVLAVAAIAVMRVSLPVRSPELAASMPLGDLLKRVDDLLTTAEEKANAAEISLSEEDALPLENQAEFKQAKALLARALVDYSNDHRVYVALARVEIRNAQRHYHSNPEAEKDIQCPASIKKLLDKALSISPRSKGALFWLANYHDLRGECDAVVAVDERAQKLQLDHRQVLDQTGQARRGRAALDLPDREFSRCRKKNGARFGFGGACQGLHQAEKVQEG